MAFVAIRGYFGSPPRRKSRAAKAALTSINFT